MQPNYDYYSYYSINPSNTYFSRLPLELRTELGYFYTKPCNFKLYIDKIIEDTLNKLTLVRVILKYPDQEPIVILFDIPVILYSNINAKFINLLIREQIIYIYYRGMNNYINLYNNYNKDRITFYISKTGKTIDLPLCHDVIKLLYDLDKLLNLYKSTYDI